MADMGNGLGKLQHCSFLLRKHRRLAPHTDQNQLILVIPQLQQVLGMHIQAERTAVNL
ncbi:hypothetical protein D3C76_1830000 [compost metagenome]